MINNEKKFIFVHIPKTAGSSVRYALRKHDENRRAWIFRKKEKLKKKYLGIEPPSTQLNGHSTAQDIKNVLGQKYDDYFKFSFVRNPFDLEVSLYKYILKETNVPEHEEVKNLSFAQFLEFRNRNNARSQYHFLFDSQRNCLVDFVGRFENFSSDFDRIKSKIGICHKPVHKNKTNKIPYFEFYDEKSIELVKTMFADDFLTFGYSTELGG